MQINRKARAVVFYANYFERFFLKQRNRVRIKMLWTLTLIEDIVRVPESLLKRIKNGKGLYEINLQIEKEHFRLFCFYQNGQIVILINGFRKKFQKTPKKEIDQVMKIKEAYKTEQHNITALEVFKERQYGKLGLSTREVVEIGYMDFKIGALLQEACLQNGLVREAFTRSANMSQLCTVKQAHHLQEAQLSVMQKILKSGVDHNRIFSV